MISKTVFAWTSPDAIYPGSVTISDRDADLALEVRGPKVSFQSAGVEYDVPGLLAGAVIPQAEVPRLIHALLQHPPVQEVIGVCPLVLYFGTEQQRDEFTDLIKAARPWIRFETQKGQQA